MKFAAEAHAGQTRDGSGQPYIVHPARVARVLEETGFSPVVVAAAALHDVVEDCGVSTAQVAELFGDAVAVIVERVTKEPGRDATLAKLALGSYEEQSLKAADVADNLTDAVAWMDDAFIRQHARKCESTLAVLSKAHPGLMAEAYQRLQTAKEYVA